MRILFLILALFQENVIYANRKKSFLHYRHISLYWDILVGLWVLGEVISLPPNQGTDQLLEFSSRRLELLWKRTFCGVMDLSKRICGEIDLSNMPGEACTSGEASFKLSLELSKSSIGFYGSELWSEAPEAAVNHQRFSPSPPFSRVFMTSPSDFPLFMKMSLLMARPRALLLLLPWTFLEM